MSDSAENSVPAYGLQAGHSGHGSGVGTRSVCPVCLRTINAQLRKKGDSVYLAKYCPEHGGFEAVVWRGTPHFADWSRPKIPSSPKFCFTRVDKGCPHDCGLCPEHGQHTCTALLEITQRCNLRCPICFADAGQYSDKDPDMERIGFWYDRVLQASGTCNIQLSGGEPTVRDDLPAIIAMGREKGFGFIQLNTNGLRLAREQGYAESLQRAGLSSVFLQFDGVDDAPYRTLRGAPLWGDKRRAVERCGEVGLGVVLVPTVKPGVNDHALGAILDFALEAGAHVRGVHFQPVSYFGRFDHPPKDEDRITLPEIMRGLEEQSRGLVSTTDFAPPGCEHSLCSFHGNYLRTADGTLMAMSQKRSCCAPPQPVVAAEGARKSIGYTARQWSSAAPCSCERPDAGKSHSLEHFADQARAWMFSVSAMAFQDAWNLNLDRLKGCCIHVVSPDGRLVPFCAYNLTAADGTPLYRGRL